MITNSDNMAQRLDVIEISLAASDCQQIRVDNTFTYVDMANALGGDKAEGKMCINALLWRHLIEQTAMTEQTGMRLYKMTELAVCLLNAVNWDGVLLLELGSQTEHKNVLRHLPF